MYINTIPGTLREDIPNKCCCSFGFCPIEGGGGPCSNFLASLVHFWSIKRVYFLQNANNLNFELFLRLYTWPTKQVFCLFKEESWIMSHFECRWNCRFGVQKSCTSYPNWWLGREGEREVIWAKSRRTAAFFRDVFPYASISSAYQRLMYTWCAHSLHVYRCLCILPLTRKITHLSATLNTELRSIFGVYNNQKITKISVSKEFSIPGSAML